MLKDYKSPFKLFLKKAHRPLRLAIEDTTEVICSNPFVGEAKTGDLAGFYVYKFKFNAQEYLIAYLPPIKEQFGDAALIDFLTIEFYKAGVHENFYIELKRYLKERGSP